MPGFFASIWKGAGDAASAVLGWLGDAFSSVANFIGETATGIWNSVTGAFKGIASGVIGYMGAVGDGISGLFSWLFDSFGKIADFAGESFGEIGKALMSGDWSGAAEIAWTSLKVAFLAGVFQVTKVWHEFTTGLLIAFDSMLGSIRNGWTDASSWIGKQFMKLQGMFDKDFDVEMAIQTLEEDAERTKKSILSGVEARNSARAEALSKQLADAESQLADLKAKREQAIKDAADKRGEDPNAPFDPSVASRRSWGPSTLVMGSLPSSRSGGAR